MQLMLNKEQKAIYDSGNVAIAVDMDTYQKFKVANHNGVMCLVITTAQPYIKVNPYTQETNALNLTAEETKQAIASGTIKVYRSSGYKVGDKVLTREEQIKEGVARVIDIVASLKSSASKDSTNPNDYDWVIMGDNSNRYEPVK